MTDSSEQEEKLHEWAEGIEGVLPDIASQLSDRSEDELAKLCGFLSTEFYKEALAKAIEEKKEEPSNSFFPDIPLSYFVFTENNHDHLVYTDEIHGGFVYVPERIIKSDPDFYDIKDWEPINKESLKEDCDFDNDDDINEFLENLPEPMMRKSVTSLIAAEDGVTGLIEEKFEVESQGVRYEDIFDVGGLSRWGDG